MIKISSGNAAFDLGFMHEMRMQGWTKKQANVILDYILQHDSIDAMHKSASVGLVYKDPEQDAEFYARWEADAAQRYAWCNMSKVAFSLAQAGISTIMPRPIAANQQGAAPAAQPAAAQQPQQGQQPAQPAAAQPQQQPAPATTGSVEGDVQAGQQAAQQGGGFFSRMWNGIKKGLGGIGRAVGMAAPLVLPAFGKSIGDGVVPKLFSSFGATKAASVDSDWAVTDLGSGLMWPTGLGALGAMDGGIAGAFLGALSGDGVAHGFNKGVNIGGGIGLGAGTGVTLGSLLSRLFKAKDDSIGGPIGLLGGGILGGILGHKLPTLTESEKSKK